MFSKIFKDLVKEKRKTLPQLFLKGINAKNCLPVKGAFLRYLCSPIPRRVANATQNPLYCR